MAPTPRPTADRFWEKVEKTNSCWIWRGVVLGNGYGQIRTSGADGRRWLAHRLAYELVIGPIPEGMQLDHLCRNRACVNPEHLEVVTCAENLRRGLNARSEQTHCKHGHAFDEINTYIHPVSGWRTCRRCRADRMAGRKAAA